MPTTPISVAVERSAGVVEVIIIVKTKGKKPTQGFQVVLENNRGRFDLDAGKYKINWMIRGGQGDSVKIDFKKDGVEKPIKTIPATTTKISIGTVNFATVDFEIKDEQP
jgi:RNA:NAD 2'-phosphotransferase (TPT1/KptA family)